MVFFIFKTRLSPRFVGGLVVNVQEIYSKDHQGHFTLHDCFTPRRSLRCDFFNDVNNKNVILGLKNIVILESKMSKLVALHLFQDPDAETSSA